MIASKNVLNGGLKASEVERRWLAENGGESEKTSSKRLSRASKKQSKRSSRRTSWREEEEYKEFEGEMGGRDNGIQRQLEIDMGQVRPQTHRIQTWRSEVVDSDVEMIPALPPRPGVG